MTEHEPASGFEIEAATVEEFLRLLKEREEDEAYRRGSRSPLRRAVFVARIIDQRSSRYGIAALRGQAAGDPRAQVV